MAYSDIDSGKVLNKEGLLELCSQIKAEMANNSGSGSSYTAGNGIDIDANNVISTITPQMLFYNSGMGWSRNNNTKEQIIERLKNGEVVYNPSSSITIQANELVPSGKLAVIGPVNISTGLTQNSLVSSITLRPYHYYYFIKGQRIAGLASYEAGGVLLVSSDGNFYSIIPYNDGSSASPNKTMEYLSINKQDRLTVGNGISISNNVISSTIEGLPTPPTTDGTYTLQCVVSSGAPTYSWVSV